jgi:hypothetical protein
MQFMTVLKRYMITMMHMNTAVKDCTEMHRAESGCLPKRIIYLCSDIPLLRCDVLPLLLAQKPHHPSQSRRIYFQLSLISLNISEESIVCIKYLQTFSLSTNNNVCQHCSHENRVFANIPSGERAYFCIT